MKIYIASHDQEGSRRIAVQLRQAGHFVTSSWHEEPMDRTAHYGESLRAAIAVMDIAEIDCADCVMLCGGPGAYAGGKFIEAGYAFGKGKRVAVIWRRENMLLWHPHFQFFDTVDEAIAAWKEPV